MTPCQLLHLDSWAFLKMLSMLTTAKSSSGSSVGTCSKLFGGRSCLLVRWCWPSPRQWCCWLLHLHRCYCVISHQYYSGSQPSLLCFTHSYLELLQSDADCKSPSWHSLEASVLYSDLADYSYLQASAQAAQTDPSYDRILSLNFCSLIRNKWLLPSKGPGECSEHPRATATH